MRFSLGKNKYTAVDIGSSTIKQVNASRLNLVTADNYDLTLTPGGFSD